ncbi:MAG: Fur family transcriptional regulator [Paracoccus sp. (in: a-proteobacteria)]|nr:Fur family transcriptional regulator [Paracoccus sp. (in: a-proteobacteria)]
MRRAEVRVRERGLRMTPVRKRVLEFLLEEHRALGAYEVLERLAAEGFGKQPPVAYRALDFLVEAGLAHRVQRLNAFAACQHTGDAHAPAFLICRNCRAIAEADASDLRAHLGDLAAAHGFTPERSTIEALGLCNACLAEGAGAGAEP